MNQPAQPAPAQPPVSPEQTQEWTRIAAGVLFALGMLVLFIRKAGGFTGGDEWAAFPLFVVLLLPCAALFAVALMEVRPGTPPRPWQTVYLAFAVIIVPLVLLQFVDMIGGDTGSGLNIAWIFALTAAVAIVSSLRTGALYQAFLGGLAIVIAWISLWDKILDDPSVDTFRWLLVVIAAGLLAAALALRASGQRQGDELVTAAGLSAVAAGALGALQVATSLTRLSLDGGELEGASTFWDIFLLIVSVALIAYAAGARVRGPAYAGGLGLFAFTLIIGAELGKLAEGEQPELGLVGWPLLLIVLGVIAFGLAIAQNAGPGGGGYGAPPGGGAPEAPGAQPGGLIEQWRSQPPQPGQGPPPGQQPPQGG